MGLCIYPFCMFAFGAFGFVFQIFKWQIGFCSRVGMMVVIMILLIFIDFKASVGYNMQKTLERPSLYIYLPPKKLS